MKKLTQLPSAGAAPFRLFFLSILSIPVLSMAMLFVCSERGLSAVVYDTADAYVKDGTSANSNTGSASDLGVSARGTSSDRKIYLGFDLSSTSLTTFSGSSLSLTLNTTPLIGPANGTVSINIYGITDNTALFTESAITWNTSLTGQKNDGTVNGFSSTGTVLLGTISIDSTSLTLANTTVSLSSTALADYLNWAVGNSGDFYGTGATQANGKQITLMIGMATTSFLPGFDFYSKEGAGATSSYIPQLNLVPEPSSWALLLLGSFVCLACSPLRRKI